VSTTATASATPTATATRGAADVDDVVVTTDVHPATGEPTGPRVFVWEDDPESLVTLWVTVQVSDFSNSDSLSIVVYQNGDWYGERQIPTSTISDGWAPVLIGLDAPSIDQADYIYTVAVFINGQRSLETSFQVSAIEGP
jgi:hypothetical protein